MKLPDCPPHPPNCSTVLFYITLLKSRLFRKLYNSELKMYTFSVLFNLSLEVIFNITFLLGTNIYTVQSTIKDTTKLHRVTFQLPAIKIVSTYLK